MNAIQKIIKSFLENGPAIGARKIAEGVAWRLQRLFNFNLGEKIRLLVDRRFDRKFGIDTSGLRGIKELDVTAEQKTSGIHYEPTPVPALRAMLRSIPIDHSKFTFVDYGSGKGRVLLLASEYPYRAIIGVEAAPSLHAAALDNIEKWGRRDHLCADIRSICVDARNFPLPDGALVLFFFTPFLSPVVDRVVDNIRQSFDRNARSIRIVYYGTNTHFIGHLSRLGFARREIYSKRPLSARAHYRGHLFSSDE